MIANDFDTNPTKICSERGRAIHELAIDIYSLTFTIQIDGGSYCGLFYQKLTLGGARLLKCSKHNLQTAWTLVVGFDNKAKA